MPSVGLIDAAILGLMRRHGDLCMHAVIDLRRCFSHEDLVHAMEATLAELPVLAHRYAARLWRDRWVRVDEPVSDIVHFEGDGADVEARTEVWLRRPLSASRDRPVRVVGLVRGEGMRLILSVLHIAGDGASMAALGHVFGSHLYGVALTVPVVPDRRLRGALSGLRWYHAPILVTEVLRTAAQPLEQLMARPRDRAYGDGSSEGSAWRHIDVHREQLDRLRRRCAKEVSVNDMLIAALARVGAARSSRGPVVVTYTMDLRRYGRAARLTVANTSSVLSAVIPRRKVTDLAETAGAVAEITARQRRRLTGPAFIIGAHLFGAGLPHSVARALGGALLPLLVDVPLGRGMLLTNVGRIDEALRPFGDDVESIRFIGPTIERVPVPVVVALGYRGELLLELFSPPELGASAALELEGEIRAALDL